MAVSITAADRKQEEMASRDVRELCQKVCKALQAAPVILYSSRYNLQVNSRQDGQPWKLGREQKVNILRLCANLSGW